MKNIKCGLCGGKFTKVGTDKSGTYYQCDKCGRIIKG